jgi:aromatase
MAGHTDNEICIDAPDGKVYTRLRWIQDFTVKPAAPADDAGVEDYLNPNTAIQLKAVKERIEARYAHVRSVADVPANRRREFLFVTDGVATVSMDGLDHVVHADEGIWIPKNVRHRVSNERDTPVRAVFQLPPLAPRPELGNVDTEPQRGEPVAGEGTQWTTGAGRSDSEPVAPLAGGG